MKFIDGISDRVGYLTMWLALILIILICVDVVLRYFLNYSMAWVGELEWHIFALLFLLSMGYTLRQDGHVRVDVFYENYSEAKKSMVNAIGHTLFLLPWCGIIIYTSYRYAFNSFLMNETSPNPGGLPYRYIIKYAISMSFFLLGLQGVSELIKNIAIIKSHKWKS